MSIQYFAFYYPYLLPTTHHMAVTTRRSMYLQMIRIFLRFSLMVTTFWINFILCCFHAVCILCAYTSDHPVTIGCVRPIMHLETLVTRNIWALTKTTVALISNAPIDEVDRRARDEIDEARWNDQDIYG